MSEKKRHIDDLFREKLSDNELSPPPELWNKISSDLAARNRSILFYTLRIAAGGLILLGLGGGLMYWFTQDNNWDNYLSPETTMTHPADEQGTLPVPRHAPLNSVEGDNVAAVTESEISSGQTTYENDIVISSDEGPSANSGLQQPANANYQNGVQVKHTEPAPVFNQIIHEPAGELAQRETKHSHNNSETAPQLTLLIPGPLKELTGMDMKPVGLAHWPAMKSTENALEMAIQKDRLKTERWSAMVMVAPDYSYRTLFSGSSGNFSKEHFNNYESGLFSLSGGINVVYRINDRFSLQSGLNLLRMGQKIGNVQIFNDPQVIESLYKTGLAEYYQTTPSVSNSFGPIQASTSTMYFTDNHNRELNQIGNQYSRYDLSSIGYQMDSGNEIKQGLYYLQTPLLLRYSVLKGNTGLVISGGMGANFLAGNTVLLKYDGENLNIGRTRNINSFGISGIVTIGLERRLTSKLKLLIEPRFNHFISRVNTTGSMLSLPYSFSVSGGIIYGF